MSQDHDHDHHGHDHAHEHGHPWHPHGAGYVHAPASFGKAFAIGVALNAGFVIIEVVYGFLSNSVALLADAGHNLGDVLGLLVAWTASALVRRAPSARFTYGLRGAGSMHDGQPAYALTKVAAEKGPPVSGGGIGLHTPSALGWGRIN